MILFWPFLQIHLQPCPVGCVRMPATAGAFPGHACTKKWLKMSPVACYSRCPTRTCVVNKNLAQAASGGLQLQVPTPDMLGKTSKGHVPQPFALSSSHACALSSSGILLSVLVRRTGNGSMRWECGGNRHNALLPEVISYSSGVSACEKGRKRQHALRLLVRMQRNALLTNVISSSSGVSACEKGGQWQLAFGLLVGMRHKDLLPNILS